MKKTLYLKFILAYFIFGVFGFIIVTTFVPNMTKEHLIREKAESLMVMFSDRGEKTDLYFQPPEKLLLNMKKYNPRNINI